jgi:mannose-6-phosphate isomerase-like protein (cupin superfamily)
MRSTPPEFAEITPRCARVSRSSAPSTRRIRSARSRTQILYEDDDVRVWEMILEPGEWSDLHHHEHDYILAIDSGDLVAGIPPKGHPMDFFVGKVPPQGNTVRVPKGGTEWALNVGKKRYHEILIELKKT